VESDSIKEEELSEVDHLSLSLKIENVEEKFD